MAETTTAAKQSGKGWMADPEARAERLVELQGQYGAVQNAEQLIATQRASRNLDVDSASLKGVDAEATAALDLDKIEVPEGWTLEAAVVRGNFIVWVALDENDVLRKGGQPLSDKHRSVKDADAMTKTYLRAEGTRVQKNLERQAEIDAKTEAFRRSLWEGVEGEAEADTEEMQETVAEAQEEAVAEAENAPQAAQERSVGAKPRRTGTRKRKTAARRKKS